MNWEQKYDALASMIEGYRHERNEALERVRLLEAEVERVNAREDATRREFYATCIDMRDAQRERDEARAEIAILRPWSIMLKRAHGALTDAGCVVPLEFDQSIEHAINDLARRATRAEQLFVDEYDARRDVERQRDELQARIATLEAVKP